MSETFLSHTLPETARKLEGETFLLGQGDVLLTSRQYVCWFFQVGRTYLTNYFPILFIIALLSTEGV